MSDARDTMELPEDRIRARYPAANALLEGFDHTPRIGATTPAPAAPERSPGIGTRPRFRSTTPGLVTRSTARPEGVHLIARITEADADDPLPSPAQARALRALRRGLAIALAVEAGFSNVTGLDALKRANLDNRLDPARAGEFSELLSAAALVALHAFANATAFLLAPSLEEAGEVAVEIAPLREVLTDNPSLALHGALWELDQVLAAQGANEAAMLRALGAFCEKLMEEAALRAANAPRTGAFAAVSQRIEADGLTLAGFTPAGRSRGRPLVMTFKKPHEVVGNHIAKHQAQRLARMLMAYDFTRRQNPFTELGGFIFTFMGDGAPGTGKTTLIQMMAGLLNDYCTVAGYPFRYANLSTENIDSYQGKSGQNAKAFINTVMDPSVIGFGTIDDIDQIAGKRGDRQSSTGQLEITSVLMESFAGANTVVRGNCTFGMFSNFPENVDDALRQRAGARFLVDGPKSREDYIDILHLLLGRNHAIPLGDHDLFAAQEITRAVAESYASHDTPQEAGLRRVWEDVTARYGRPETLAALGTYLKAIQEADPRFTGRAIKNITDAIKVRAMDFDMPDEWMETPEAFMHRDYAAKKAMVAELMRPITLDMVIQEINRYADSEFRYADTSDERAIDDMVRQMRLSESAKRRYLEDRA